MTAPCRQSLSSLSGPLQVVPDIDDQMSSADSSQEVSWGGRQAVTQVLGDQPPGRAGGAGAEGPSRLRSRLRSGSQGGKGAPSAGPALPGACLGLAQRALLWPDEVEAPQQEASQWPSLALSQLPLPAQVLCHVLAL